MCLKDYYIHCLESRGKFRKKILVLELMIKILHIYICIQEHPSYVFKLKSLIT